MMLIIESLAAPAITGAITGVIVVVSLRVHVDYLRREVGRNRDAIRAVDRRLNRTREAIARQITEG